MRRKVARAVPIGDPAAEWVAVDVLRPWAKNPRNNDKAVEKVAESIRRFGFAAPIVARRSNGEVIAGHTRLKAAIFLKLDRVPVRYLDISAAEAHLLALADNKLGEIAVWEEDGLASLLTDIPREDALLAGFTESDLRGLIDQTQDVVEDAIPELPTTAITKTGDVWKLGRHRLICGDSRDPNVYRALLGDVRVQLFATDPPYGVEVVGGSHDPRAKTYQAGKSIENDELVGADLVNFLVGSFSAAEPYLVPGCSWYIWHAGSRAEEFIQSVKVLGGFRHILIWVKPNFVFGRSDYHYRHESCLYGWKGGAGHKWLGNRKQDSVFETARDGAVAELKHPTVKPVELYRRKIENHLLPDEALLDIFAGSGPAFSAAEQLGRCAYGIELSPGFCDVIVERWQNLTGGKAVLL